MRIFGGPMLKNMLRKLFAMIAAALLLINAPVAYAAPALDSDDTNQATESIEEQEATEDQDSDADDNEGEAEEDLNEAEDDDAEEVEDDDQGEDGDDQGEDGDDQGED